MTVFGKDDVKWQSRIALYRKWGSISLDSNLPYRLSQDNTASSVTDLMMDLSAETYLVQGLVHQPLDSLGTARIKYLYISQTWEAVRVHVYIPDGTVSAGSHHVALQCVRRRPAMWQKANWRCLLSGRWKGCQHHLKHLEEQQRPTGKRGGELLTFRYVSLHSSTLTITSTERCNKGCITLA
jgi:hypothetical protein